jgi:hypothetical protein
MNPRSDAFYAAWVEGEPNMPYITNRLELLLSDIAPRKKLHFIVYYLPLQTKKQITFPGGDRYEVSYKWEYKGGRFSDVQWRMVENDRLTTPPPGMISVIRYSKDPNATFSPIIRKRKLGK